MNKIITRTTVLVLFVFAIAVMNYLDSEHIYANSNHIHVQKNAALKQVPSKSIEQKTDSNEITHAEIVKLTDTFMDLLVQEVDDHYKVVRFNTKEELINAFEPYIVREAVQPYIDFYFKEKEDGLYILPTETPPWFDKDEDYNKKIEDNKVTITQANENALYGKYTIEMGFEKMDGTWKIVNISHK
ncbi:hypothetical protein ACTNEO_03990 [Gracilibacillus sp. HCP3S3_G5_1]|uniref:hypothetical protein n=1 Tax=unclassified Gracilibacillus TaxID=2625209 RepID=UPI003F8B8422